MSTADPRADTRPTGTPVSDSYSAARRLQVLLGAALGSVLTSYLIMAVVAALAVATASTPPAPLGVLSAGLPLWLAAHQVPLMITGAPLGALPLLPTVGIAALIANFAAAAVGKLSGRWGGEAAWVVATMAVAHSSLAVLSTALPTDPVRAEPWPALLGAGLVAAAGAGLGVLRAAGAPDWWPFAPGWLRTALTSAATGITALFTAGALILLAALAADVRALHDGFAVRPGFGPGVGVAVLSVCYLPNALVAAVSWLAGPGVIVGSAVASPLGVSVGPLPPLPLFAAMPTSQPPGWAVVAFALPVAAGVVIGLGCRRTGDDAMARLRAVGLAVVVVALVFAVLAILVSGRLAGGPFDPVDLPAFSGAFALLGWLGVPASLVATAPAEFGRRWSRRPGRVADLPGVRGRSAAGGAAFDAAESASDAHEPQFDAEGSSDAHEPDGGRDEQDVGADGPAGDRDDRTGPAAPGT